MTGYARPLSGLEKYLVDQHFKWSELSRSYSPSGIYARVQRFLEHDLDEALERFARDHDGLCELKNSEYRNCACFYRRPVVAIEADTEGGGV